MKYLTEDDKLEISKAIQAAEQKSSGELVAIIADQSDEYFYIPILWAAIGALALPGIWFLINHGWITFSYMIYVIQITIFFTLSILIRWRPLRMMLIPKSVKHRRAGALARQQFITLGLHGTPHRAAILIFVSVAEHYVEIIADSGIDERVEDAGWQDIVDSFIEQVKAKQFASGFLIAIEKCSQLLSTHFPPTPGVQDHLPNHLIEI